MSEAEPSVEARWIARAERAGAAGGPARPGEEKSRTDAIVAAMRAEGLVAAFVGPEYGGPGLSLATVARITERLARASGSAGLIYAMHMSQALCLSRHGRGAFFESFQRRMVAEQILIASGTSEKGPGGDIFTSIASFEADGPGRLKGHKESPNISYLDHAGAILLTANHHPQGGRARQALALLDMAAVQVAPARPATLLGMKGILNQPAALDFTLPEEALFPDPFPTVARRTMTPSIQILWAALWSGIAWAVLEKARLFLHGEVKDSEAAVLARRDLADLITRHFAMNAMIRDVLAEYEGEVAGKAGTSIGFGAAARINRLKIACSDWLVEICSGALRLMGLRAYAAEGPYALAEPLADAFSAPIMVSNTRLLLNTAAIDPFADECL